jgi:hypothetical protein
MLEIVSNIQVVLRRGGALSRKIAAILHSDPRHLRRLVLTREPLFLNSVAG